MFLAKITLDKATALRKKVLTPYSYHQLLWEAFPGRPDDARDFLFRWDDRRDHDSILLLSELAPTVPDWGLWQVKSFDAEFPAGSFFRFQLRANPVVRRSGSGRLEPVAGEEELTRWLAVRAESHGFRLTMEPVASPPAILRFRKPNQSKLVTFQQVDFAGYLQVTDSGLFAGAFRGGIGRGKAFGCGMMLLQGVHPSNLA